MVYIFDTLFSTFHWLPCFSFYLVGTAAMSAVENDFWAKIANLKELKVSCALGMHLFK
jgi:hypothetical protein